MDSIIIIIIIIIKWLQMFWKLRCLQLWGEAVQKIIFGLYYEVVVLMM
jgi:hypothetical protein